MSIDKPSKPFERSPDTTEANEGIVLAQYVQSLNRLAMCQNFEEAALIFLENPAAFTTNESRAVASSTKLSLVGAVAFSRYLTLSGEGFNAVRLNQIQSRFQPRPPKQGIDQYGQTFTRQERVPEVTMQTTEFLFPEIIVTLFKRGIEQDEFALPENITINQLIVLVDVLFSVPLQENFENIKSVISDLDITTEQLQGLCDYLLRLKGEVVQPLIATEVGETDLAANTIISFKAKLELYLMLEQA